MSSTFIWCKPLLHKTIPSQTVASNWKYTSSYLGGHVANNRVAAMKVRSPCCSESSWALDDTNGGSRGGLCLSMTSSVKVLIFSHRCSEILTVWKRYCQVVILTKGWAKINYVTPLPANMLLSRREIVNWKTSSSRWGLVSPLILISSHIRHSRVDPLRQRNRRARKRISRSMSCRAVTLHLSRWDRNLLKKKSSPSNITTINPKVYHLR